MLPLPVAEGAGGGAGPTVAGGEVEVGVIEGGSKLSVDELAPDDVRVEDPELEAWVEFEPEDDAPELEADPLIIETGTSSTEMAVVSTMLAVVVVPPIAISSHAARLPEIEHSARRTMLAEGRTAVSNSSLESSMTVTFFAQ